MITYQAAIFDMDGLLLDTERLCMAIFEEACESLSLPFYRDIYLTIIGRNAAGIKEIFSGAYGDACDTVIDEWRNRYCSVVERQAIPVKQGVVELLEWLESEQVPMAVATSTASPVAQKKLELAGLDNYFSAVVTGCEVNQGKPDPEIFQLAASRLKIEPQACIAFEDSNNGARAAIAAGMYTYQIPDLVGPCAELQRSGHIVMPSMVQVLHQLRKKKRST